MRLVQSFCQWNPRHFPGLDINDRHGVRGTLYVGLFKAGRVSFCTFLTDDTTVHTAKLLQKAALRGVKALRATIILFFLLMLGNEKMLAAAAFRRC